MPLWRGTLLISSCLTVWEADGGSLVFTDQTACGGAQNDINATKAPCCRSTHRFVRCVVCCFDRNVQCCGTAIFSEMNLCKIWQAKNKNVNAPLTKVNFKEYIK